jgi:hypothetical protein
MKNTKAVNMKDFSGKTTERMTDEIEAYTLPVKQEVQHG